MGEHWRLTVVSPEDRDGTQLLLEPDAHPAGGNLIGIAQRNQAA